jgi:lipopolysaccharide/colanic/teichoic acid biosynthesis glycosyltransferase
MATTLEPRAAWRTVRLVHPTPLDPIDREQRGRRLLNLVVATLGLALALPLMVAIAVLIKLTSRGPVCFRQTRIGLDRRSLSRAGGNTRRHLDLGGKPFTMYKFRSMYVEHENPRHQVWAQRNDPRVTLVGRMLRRVRLDELPQLFNVLRGDMNIVGPRPEQPVIFIQLREQIEGYQRRQRVRPGITGLAQVSLPYDRTVNDVRRKVAVDLAYVRRQSPREDLLIMLRTLPVMLGARGGW